MKSITVDYTKRLAEEPDKGHNRWHEGITPVVEAALGEEIEIETRDAFDGQIGAATTAEDLRRCDLNLVHPLTGPVFVAGAQPGDLLEVEIRDMKPASFAYTVQVPGFGFLRDAFPDPYIAKWAIRDGFAESADLPGVRIPDGSFVGVIGVAPSKELREAVRRREANLAGRGGVALPPEPQGAVPGGAIAAEALRTIPPRENGGNLDVPQVREGSRLLLPVHVPGALLSVGDAHFAQGEGEVCGTAIEVAATVTLEVSLRRPETVRWRQRFPAIEYTQPPPEAARPCFQTTGIPLDDRGENEDVNVTVAARRALLEMIDWLGAERGLRREQAYVLASVAADLRVAEVVNIPNALVTCSLALDVFEQDAPAR